MPTITATITARGVDSTVPENDTAVDAEIIVDGVTVGEVTLLIGDDTERPELDTWGDLDHWASWDLQEWFDLVGDSDDDFESNHGINPHDAVVRAVRLAA